MTITEFLLARIAEDEQQADDYWDDGDDGPGTWLGWIKAECEAKRRIVEMLMSRDEQDHPAVTAHATGLRLAVKALASVNADHPNFDENWRA